MPARLPNFAEVRSGRWVPLGVLAGCAGRGESGTGDCRNPGQKGKREKAGEETARACQWQSARRQRLSFLIGPSRLTVGPHVSSVHRPLRQSGLTHPPRVLFPSRIRP